MPARASDLAAVAGEEFLAGNQLDLLIDGEATFDAILAEIAPAKHWIFVQFYIMRDDGLGRVCSTRSPPRPRRRRLCFLIDSFGSTTMTPR